MKNGILMVSKNNYLGGDLWVHKEGIQYHWNKNGGIISIENYKFDKLDGKQLYWSGITCVEKNFKDGILLIQNILNILNWQF